MISFTSSSIHYGSNVTTFIEVVVSQDIRILISSSVHPDNNRITVLNELEGEFPFYCSFLGKGLSNSRGNQKNAF